MWFASEPPPPQEARLDRAAGSAPGIEATVEEKDILHARMEQHQRGARRHHRRSAVHDDPRRPCHAQRDQEALEVSVGDQLPEGLLLDPVRVEVDRAGKVTAPVVFLAIPAHVDGKDPGHGGQVFRTDDGARG